MKRSYIRIFTSFIIVGLLVAGCTATGKKKATKGFKHNTPLIKTDVKELGKVELEKMAKMGPTPVEGDVVKLKKRKKLSSVKEKNYLFRYNLNNYSKLSKYLNFDEKKWLASFI